MHRRALQAAAFAAAAAAWLPPSGARALERIPFTESNGAVEVKATIDNRPATMRVDLGAGVEVLSQRLGTQLVNVDGKFVTLALNGRRVDLPIGTVVSIALGEYQLDNKIAGIWNGLDGSGVDGIVSAVGFRNVSATFDYRAREISIEDAVTFADRRRFASRVPLMLQDELGIALIPFAKFDFGNGQSGMCVIDTGLPGIAIDRRFAAKLGVNLNRPGATVTTKLGSGVAAAIPRLALADAPDSAMVNPQVTFADLVYDCNVGNAFWGGKIFTLDLPHRVMYVAPPG
jgi:predicted aspartyl protease